jgi:hypothetical protein
MEDGASLSQEDKTKLAALIKELETLKLEHKKFASTKSSLSSEQKEAWRANSQRINQVHIEMKDLRLKNILEAGR